MNRARDIKEAIKSIVGASNGGTLFLVGEVKSVDGECCTVDVAGLELDEVRLTAVSDGAEEKLLITPKTGSKVLIADLSEGGQRDLAVVGYTNVEKIEGSFDQITLNGGDNGGLVNIQDLTDKLNNLEKDINNLKQAFMVWAPVPQDGGAALKTGVSAWASQRLVQTQVSDMEDTKIKH